MLLCLRFRNGRLAVATHAAVNDRPLCRRAAIDSATVKTAETRQMLRSQTAGSIVKIRSSRAYLFQENLKVATDPQMQVAMRQIGPDTFYQIGVRPVMIVRVPAAISW